MRAFILVLTFGMAVSALADEGTITGHVSDARAVSSTNNFSEVGLQYSSINDGTPFATLAMIHDFQSGFSLGVRGGMPLQFQTQASSYLAEVLARFMLMNDMNQMYVEPSITEVFFNTSLGSTYFGMVGASYGYNRVIYKDVVVGGHVGVDYSPARVSGNTYTSNDRTLYSKIAFTGSYYF